MSLERMWAGWRGEYVGSVPRDDGDRDDSGAGCVFCRILAGAEPDDATYVVRREQHAFAILNAYPYVTAHLLVMPVRHVAELEDVAAQEAAALWGLLADAVRAVKAAYSPEGLNVGANVGRVAGAGIPGHFHLHCLPRWSGDTNFMTSVAEVRVLPEALPITWAKLREAWPA